jgi:dTDP-4-amino-4,6-dideoxygalactose transaminase
MRISKIPIVATPITARDLRAAFKHMRGNAALLSLTDELLQYHKLPHIFLTGSGTQALYLILKTLQGRSSKKEIIVPAYCAKAVVIAVLNAGLKPVLCDISLDDFNINTQAILRSVTSETLAIVCAHMFGIPMKDIVTLRYKLPPDIFIIEDFCQAMGSKINGIPTGNWGDFAFTSFNRGKNIPAYGGGYCLTQNHTLAQDFEGLQREYTRAPGFAAGYRTVVRQAVLALCTRPFWYAAGYPLIARFKAKSPGAQVSRDPLLPVQAGLVSALLRRIEEYSEVRNGNGHYIVRELQDFRPVFLAKLPAYVLPAYNRFPIMFKDTAKLQAVAGALEAAGIETSPMYTRPLHHDFDLGYTIDEFPHSRYFAQHVLTIPVHPFVTREHLQKIVSIIRDLC